MNTKNSFVIPYHNGALWISCLDGYTKHSVLVKEKIARDEQMICRLSTPAYCAFQLCNTEVDAGLAKCLVENLLRSQPFVKKSAFVGLTKKGIKNISLCLQNAKQKFDFIYAFFDDFELAKEWLL